MILEEEEEKRLVESVYLGVVFFILLFIVCFGLYRFFIEIFWWLLEYRMNLVWVMIEVGGWGFVVLCILCGGSFGIFDLFVFFFLIIFVFFNMVFGVLLDWL